ncbi:MAG TPA: UTP--glucose-1-phosphate uridylyltransferase, partial [Candidatus Omnitrophota bacterium]|nr:UTP--glucose-1-phosphate uridylyltransferase [Candidatus Omnitrophota bacterium]
MESVLSELLSESLPEKTAPPVKAEYKDGGLVISIDINTDNLSADEKNAIIEKLLNDILSGRVIITLLDQNNQEVNLLDLIPADQRKVVKNNGVISIGDYIKVEIACINIIINKLSGVYTKVKIIYAKTQGNLQSLPEQEIATVPSDNIKTDNLPALSSRYSPSAMADRLNTVIGQEALARLNDLIAQRGEAAKAVNLAKANENKDEIKLFAAEVTRLDKEIDKIINEVNARGVLAMLNKLDVSPVAYIEDTRDDQAGIDALIAGKLCIQMPFAGAGSRMENSLAALGVKLPHESDYRLANIDIWMIAQAMGKQLYDKAISEGKTAVEAAKIVSDAGLITEIPANALRLGLGEREMIALEQGILDLKRTHNLSDTQIQAIFDQLTIIVSVSDEIKDNTYRIFTSPSKLSGRSFFGFKPENIVFVEGGYGDGFGFDKQGKLAPLGGKSSWNHGYAFVELSWIHGEHAFTLTGEKTPTNDYITMPLKTPVFQYVQDKGALYGCIHRINDLILMHPTTALDVEMFGSFLNFISLPGNEDVNLAFEMMANPTAQKGGMALTIDGRQLILLEGLTTQSPAVQELLKEITNEELARTQGHRGVPYNRLYGYYNIADLVKSIATEDMPLPIKFKQGVITPEIPTGDVTWLHGVRAVAMVRKIDLFIDSGILPNEQRDGDNNAICDAAGRPKLAWSDADGGTGSIIHDCKAAIYIKDGLRVVEALDSRQNSLFEDGYYGETVLEIPAASRQLLSDARFDATEEPTSAKYRAAVKNGLTPETNNPIKGKILTAPESNIEARIVDLRDEDSPAMDQLKALGKGIKTAFAYSAGGLSSRGGGIFTAKFKFPTEIPEIGGIGFTEIKFNQATKAGALPIVILTSFIRMDAVAEALDLNLEALRKTIVEDGVAFYEIGGLPVYIFAQGVQERIIPTDEALTKYAAKAIAKKDQDLKKQVESKKITPEKAAQELADYTARLNRGIAYEQGKAGQILRLNSGAPVVNPPGHFDFIRYLAVSGVLGALHRDGVRFVFHSNLNNPAANVTDLLKGAFESEIQKAKAEGRPEPVSMFLLGENRGEKGGLLAEVIYENGKHVTQLVEGIALTAEANQLINEAVKNKTLAKIFPYFNTATFFLNIEALMDLFNLPKDNELTLEERIKLVDVVTAQVPVYMDLKEEADGEMILVGYQLERIYGDITAIAHWVPAVVNRDKHFIPVKEMADIQNAEKMKTLAGVLKSVGINAEEKPGHLLESRYNSAAMTDRLNTLIGQEDLARLNILLANRGEAVDRSDKAEVDRLDKEIDKIINEVNARGVL